MAKQKKKKVSFIATKYKNRKTRVSFYTRKGKRVDFDAVKKAPTKERVEFYTESPSKKKKRK